MDEQTATQASAGVQEGGADPDPFAEVPAAETFGEEGHDLPPGVQPGSLGGDNPSEAPAPAEEEVAHDSLTEEPTGGEFLEEPPEPDLAPEADPPAPPEEWRAEEVPVVHDEPPQGEPATPVEGSAPAGGETSAPEGEAEVPTAPVEEPVPEEPPIGDQPEGEAVSEPEEPEAKAAPGPKKRKRKPRKKKAEKGQRGYVILRLASEENPDHAFQPGWVEAFERDIPIGDKGSEPVTIDSRSSEMALRMAYRRLSENGEASYTLLPVPEKLFNPKHVEGKVPENALAIKVN